MEQNKSCCSVFIPALGLICVVLVQQRVDLQMVVLQIMTSSSAAMVYIDIIILYN